MSGEETSCIPSNSSAFWGERLLYVSNHALYTIFYITLIDSILLIELYQIKHVLLYVTEHLQSSSTWLHFNTKITYNSETGKCIKNSIYGHGTLCMIPSYSMWSNFIKHSVRHFFWLWSLYRQCTYTHNLVWPHWPENVQAWLSVIKGISIDFPIWDFF